MKYLINPILKDGQSKVSIIRSYERRLAYGRIDMFLAIFIYNNIIYLYRVEYDSNYMPKYKNLQEFGELEPLNMEKAVKALKNNI